MVSAVCACVWSVCVCVYVHEHAYTCTLESKIGLSPAWDFPGVGKAEFKGRRKQRCWQEKGLSNFRHSPECTWGEPSQ